MIQAAIDFHSLTARDELVSLWPSISIGGSVEVSKELLDLLLAELPPDPARIVLLHCRFDQQTTASDRALPILPSTNESWPASPLDIVLVVGTFGRLDSLSLFAHVFDLLPESGRLIILADFCKPHPIGGRKLLPLIEPFIDQVDRCGFELQERRDIPQPVGWEYRRSLLIFCRSEPPRWRLHIGCAEDAFAMRHLFEECFNQPMSQELWEWKYGDGRGYSIWGEWNGEMVGHLGIMQRKVIWQRRLVTAGQFGDLMILPGHRGGGQNGLLFRMASTLIELHIGYGSTYLLGFAFPYDKQMSLYEGIGIAVRVGRMVQHEWAFTSFHSNKWLASRPLNLPRDASRVDHLWELMRADLPRAVVGVRDSTYLDYRYLKHPTIIYQMHLIYHRWTLQPVGVIVLKMEPERAVLVDVVGAVRYFPVLVVEAQRIAYQAGKTALHAWIDKTHAHLLTCENTHIRDLDIYILNSIWTLGPDLATIQNAWFLTMGDTDYL